MSKKNHNTFFAAQLDAIKAQMEADELAIEDLKQDDEISDTYIELVYEVEELTGAFITAKTSATEVTAITRQYLAAIGK